MKKYYPLISIVVGAVMLLLPVGLLAMARSSQRVEEQNELAAANEQVTQQLGVLSERLAELEQRLSELRQQQLAQPAVTPPVGPAHAEPVPTTTVATIPGETEVTEPRKSGGQTARPAADVTVTKDEKTSSVGNVFASLMTRLVSGAPTETPAAAPRESPRQAKDNGPPATPPRETNAPDVDKPPSESKVATTSKSSAAKSGPKHGTPNGTEPNARDQQTSMPAGPLDIQMIGDINDLNAIEHAAEITISRPEPGNVVGRWENLVAATHEPGWPVVLVRSEVKGDSWWVQQLVTRRGNVIAARVNFGNVETISGHGFELVVLLLDNSAEAVRFRTAREFQSIPPGVRRSKVFRYVRE